MASKIYTPIEVAILDILRIEKAKGGAMASRRMKKRALKYARQTGTPEHVVEKLMLDEYPDDFVNVSRANWLIVWACLIVLFVGGAIAFAFPAYYYYDIYTRCSERLQELEDKGVDYTYSSTPEQSLNAKHNYQSECRSCESSKERNFNEFLIYSCSLYACLGVAALCLGQFRKTKKRIYKQLNHED